MPLCLSTVIIFPTLCLCYIQCTSHSHLSGHAGHITAAFNSKAFEDNLAGKGAQRGQPAQCRIRGRACARYVTYTNKLFVITCFDSTHFTHVVILQTCKLTTSIVARRTHPPLYLISYPIYSLVYDIHAGHLREHQDDGLRALWHPHHERKANKRKRNINKVDLSQNID